MAGIYGEMEQKQQLSDRMFNLTVSQILDTHTKTKASISHRKRADQSYTSSRYKNNLDNN